MTYKELQSALKSAKAQGLTNVKLNAKKDVLQAEYDRLNAIEEDYGIDEDEEEYVDPETSRTNIDEPLVKPEPTRREILAKMLAEASDDTIDKMWEKLTSAPAPAPAPEIMHEDSPVFVSDSEILDAINKLDIELGTGNYLPIYHIRNAFPRVNRGDMDEILYSLQRNNKIDLRGLVDAQLYTHEQVNAGISQRSGSPLFFIELI